MNEIQMKRAVRMNGWCFAGDERTIQTTVKKLSEKGFELQLTLDDEAVVGKLLIDLARDAEGEYILGLKISTNPGKGFNLVRVNLEKDGKVL